MNKVMGISAVLALSVGLYGCNSSSSTPRTNVSIIHASSDAPAVNVSVAGQTIQGADYKDVARVQVRTGTRSVSVDGILPGNTTATVIGPTNLFFNRQLNYEIIAVGNVGDDTLEPLVLTDTRASVASNEVRLRVAHLSPAAEAAAGGPVSVHVTAFGDPLDEPLFSFSFKDVQGPLTVPAGEYQIRVTPEGDNTVVYDSGAVNLPGGTNLLVGAVDNTFFGDAPISLLVLNNGQKFTDIPDVGSQAGIRAVHNSYDAPNVDIYINDPDFENAPAIADLAFPLPAPGAAKGDYAPVPEGDVQVTVTAAGVQASPVIDETLELPLGKAFTVLAANELANIEPLVFEDNNRSVATAARLRVIHGAGSAPNVDVYLLPGFDAMIGNTNPVLTNVPYKASSGYLDVAAGDYTVIVAVAGTGGTGVAIGPANVTLSEGMVYTVVARENADFGTTGEFGLTLLDDFAAP